MRWRGRPEPPNRPGAATGSPTPRLRPTLPTHPALTPRDPPYPPYQILRHVRGHSNVITLLDLFPPSVGIDDFR